MDIELRHLRYFVAITEELHFGRAAARLNISQPPLSQQIQILEQQVGARSLVRTNRSVALASVGKQLLADNRQILGLVNETAAKAERLHLGEVRGLRIGFTSSAPFTKAVSDTLSLLRQSYPAVHMRTREMNTCEQTAPLSEGVLDLGLLRSTQPPETLECGVILHESLMAMVPRAHSLAQKPMITLAELASEPFIFFDPHAETGLYNDILGLVRRYGLKPTIAREVGGVMTIVGLVAARLGASILPASFRRVQLYKIRWISIAEEDTVSEMWLVWPRHYEQGHVMQRFREQLLTVVQTINLA